MFCSLLWTNFIIWVRTHLLEVRFLMISHVFLALFEFLRNNSRYYLFLHPSRIEITLLRNDLLSLCVTIFILNSLKNLDLAHINYFDLFVIHGFPKLLLLKYSFSIENICRISRLCTAKFLHGLVSLAALA